MILAAAGSFLLPWCAGSLLVARILPGSFPRIERCAAAVALGAGVGLGAASCTAFAGLLCFGALDSGFVLMDATFFSLSLLALLIFRRRRGPPALSETPWEKKPIKPLNSFPFRRLIRACFAVCVLFSLLVFFVHTNWYPFGIGDGLQIQGIRARFLFSEAWRDMLQLPWIHPEYPLLIPALVARGWAYAGIETSLIIGTLNFLYMAGMLVLLTAFVSARRGESWGLIAGILLMAAFGMVKLSSQLYADPILAFYFLGAAAVMTLPEASPWRAGMLAGILASLAAWIKNEGLLFLVALAAAFFISTAASGRRKRALFGLAAYCIGASPVLCLCLYFMFHLAHPPNLFAQGWLGIKENLLDWGRYERVASLWGAHFFSWEGHLLLVVLLFLLLTGVRSPGRMKLPACAVGLTLTFMLFGYFCAYLITPRPLFWQVWTTLDRLLLQVWPLAVLLVCLLAGGKRAGAGTAPRAGAKQGPKIAHYVDYPQASQRT